MRLPSNQRGITPIPSTPNHRQFIEDVKDYIKNNTIVEGYCDVIQDSLGDYRVENNNFYSLLGNMSSEQIDDVFKCSDFDYSDGVNMKGIYSYTACLYHSPSSWEEPGETYIDYIVFTLIETFEARDRNLKLMELLGGDDDLLNLF
jgi:hypothetical protein